MRPMAVTLNVLSLRRWLIVWLVAAVSPVAFAAAEYNPVTRRPPADPAPVAHRFIVKMRATGAARLQAQTTASRESIDAAAATERVKALAGRVHVTMNASRALSANLHVMKVTPSAGESEEQTLEKLRGDSDVEYAVADRRVYPHATQSSDPLEPGQWFLQATQPAAINAIGAWDTTKGSDSIVIAVVDTGVRFEHPDLAGRLLAGYDFISPNSATSFKDANDGDGRDADASDPGDWVDSADNCGAPSNSSWHGTRTSGIIGATTNNAVGVAGVTWNSKILPVRVIGKCGGFNSDVLAGMLWAAGQSVPGVPANANPARVINVSLGSSGSCDSASADVTSQLASLGVLIVVSAGNEGGPVDSPANCPGAMGVLGLRHAGTKVGFSSLGREIALGAPGGNCVNTAAGQPCLFSLDTTSNSGTTTPGSSIYTDQFNTNLGTSFSAPIVSGIAGLMLAINPSLKSPQLIARLKEGASPFPTTSDNANVPTCHVPTSSSDIQNTECICTTSACGAGMANANGAVLAALRPLATIVVQGTVTPGATLTLQGGTSSAATGHAIRTYSWTKGGASLGTGPSASLTVPASRTSSACLTVTDDVGKQDTAKVTINQSSAEVSVVPAGTDGCVEVSIAATDASAAEAGPDTGMFTITRAGGSTTAALTVSLSLSGTATNGTDYQTIASSVVIPAGAASATVTVTPIDDTVADPAETVIATIQSGTGYDVGSADSATITISDNDAAAPPPTGSSSSGGGKGGGGAFDALTLLGALGFAIFAALRRSGGGRQATAQRAPIAVLAATAPRAAARAY
jgi:serine protease